MHADLWITDDNRPAVYVSGTPHPEGRVTLTIGSARLSVPDRTARNLVHALLAHYAGRVDFHLLEAGQVEPVEDGLRVSLAQLNREALGLEGDRP